MAHQKCPATMTCVIHYSLVMRFLSDLHITVKFDTKNIDRISTLTSLDVLLKLEKIKNFLEYSVAYETDIDHII